MILHWVSSSDCESATLKGVSILRSGWVQIWYEDDTVALVPPHEIVEIVIDDHPSSLDWDWTAR